MLRIDNHSTPLCSPCVLKQQESHIHDVVRQARHLENTYGRYFDHNILFRDMESAGNEVVGLVDRLATEQQWVPASWLVENKNTTP